MIRRIAHDIPFVSDQREADDSAPEFQRKDWQGVVEFLDPSNGAALVVLKGGVSAPEGERLNCLVPADDGQTMLSFPCRVVHARPGMIGLEPLNQFGQSRLRPGVKLVVRRNEPLELPHPQQETLSQQETPSEEPNGSEIMSISAETDAAATSWLNPFRQ